MADKPHANRDPWLARLVRDGADIRPLRIVRWSCLDWHLHETEAEAAACIERRIAANVERNDRA